MSRPARTRPKPREKPEKRAREPRWLAEGKLLADELRARDLQQTVFAEQLGVRFHNVHRWCKGFEFHLDNQELAATALGYDREYFARMVGRDGKRQKRAPGVARRAQLEQWDAETRAALEAFERECAVAARMTPPDWAVLRSVRFHDPAVRPTKAFFEAVAFALIGAIRIDEIQEVARLNAELDRQLAHKAPLKRR